MASLVVLLALPAATFAGPSSASTHSPPSGPVPVVASAGPSSYPARVPHGSPNAPCDGPFPAFAGAGPYPAGCYGRDQAIVGFYSGLAGSAGNVSLQLTLPSDRATNANQSDLYRAFWLGLVLSDPSAWMSQCFLEIRFQPDSAYAANGTPHGSPNNWTGTVVGYEIDPNGSTEDACFDQPLLLSGAGNSSYFSAAGGDVLNITTTGWAGSTTGEEVTVVDSTSGARAQVLGAVDEGAPLDPAFSASDVPDALSWAAAEVLPVSFGVELAGGANPSVIANSTFGGCTPGVPPSTRTNPSTPCPSYDPASWANDTAAPLRVAPPMFSSGGTTVATTEFAFASTVGGTAGVLALSNGTCAGRSGSSYCTYPWFSYSCGAGALEFGATDFSGVTTDFGTQSEFPTSSPLGLLGHAQFTAGNAGIPACGTGASSVDVGVSAGSGSVAFLGTNVTNLTAFGVAAGQYAISAQPAPGSFFAGWTVGGAVSVASADAATTLVVPGAGSVRASFAAAPSSRTVDFSAVGGNATLVVGPGAPGTSVGLPATLANGGTVALAAGEYPIQIVPAGGEVLSLWSTGSGAWVADPSAPAGWLTVGLASPAVNLTATLGPAIGPVTFVLRGTGNGTLTFNGTAIPYQSTNETSFATLSERAGGYAIVATPAPGWSFLGWREAPGAVSVAAATGEEINVTLANGTAYLLATFEAAVTVVDSPGSGGLVSLNGSAPLSNGSTVLLPRGNYALDAVPTAGKAFQHWQVSDGNALEVLRPGFPITRLIVNSTATVTAVFANATAENVTFVLSSSSGGYVQFNFENLTANSTFNGSVVGTTYELKAFSYAAWRFNGFTTTGAVSITGGQLTITGSGGVVTAHFVLRLYPVTFVATRPGAVTMSINGAAVLSGTTLYLARGSYNLSASVTAGAATFLEWSSVLPISNASASGANASVRVEAPGTIMGIVATFVLTRLGVAPNTTDVGTPVQFTVYANGTGPLGYRYFGLPDGCRTADAAVLTCVPDAAGNFSTRATVTDAGGAVESTPNVTVAIVAGPTVGSFGVAPAATDVNLSVTFVAVPRGGAGPYSFAYSNLPKGCTSSDTPTLPCTPTGPGTFLVEVAVTDALGVVGYDNTTLRVNPDASVVGATWSPAVVDTGILAVLSTVSSGGTGALTYTYANLPSNCSSSDSPTIDCTATAPGAANVTVTVTDSLGSTGSRVAGLVVHARPHGAVLTFSPSTLALGATTSVAATVVGGSPPLTYDYVGLPPGCDGANSSSFVCTPTTNASFPVELVVTDAFGARTDANATLTVQGPPSKGPTNSTSSPTHGIDWRYVAVIALVALALSVVLIWRFGRPPPPAPRPPVAPAPAARPPERPAAYDESVPSGRP